MVHHALARAAALLLAVCLAGAAVAAEKGPCRIEVVEKDSLWGVPLIELRTDNQIRLLTDNAGLIAVDQPDLLGREVRFDVIGHGYEVPKDAFDRRSVLLTPKPGQTLRVEVTRTNIARRLGRITGAGIFAESQKLGLEPHWQESGVMGCDSVQNAVYRGRCYWLWGDTRIFGNSPGIFDCTGATTAVEPLKSFEPPLRLRLDYFRDDQGQPRGIAKMPGNGPTWVSGYVSLPDRGGRQRLVGCYFKIKPPLEAYKCGLCVWNDQQSQFEPLNILWTKSDDAPNPPPLPNGHAALWTDPSGKSWVLFGEPLPKLRCPATFEAYQDRSTWVTLQPQPSLPSAVDGSPVLPAGGSIAWSPFRKRWVTVFVQRHGKPSILGEVWYAEADSPTGPWGPAVKVLTHENYTFYNPTLHPEFTAADSPILLFEGTYSAQFAHRARPTPRYDYNQILYRLDLNDPALRPAQQK